MAKTEREELLKEAFSLLLSLTDAQIAEALKIAFGG